MSNKTNDRFSDKTMQYDPFIPSAQSMQQETSGSNQKQMGSKNLSMIQDMLTHEAMAYKKCTVYANYFTDESLKNMAACAAAHHKQHFESLENYINCHQ